MARENIDDLCDEGIFVEYGLLVIVVQCCRRLLQELMEKILGDGMVIGLVQVNGVQFGVLVLQCVVMIYDYIVMVGI